MTDKKYTYFVSYSFVKGFGNSKITTGAPIDSFDDIRAIEAQIQEVYGAERPVVLNYILMNSQT